MGKYCQQNVCFKRLSISLHLLSILSLACRLGCLIVLAVGSTASTAGLPFTEDFSSQALMDKSQTTANWSTAEKKVVLAWREHRLHQLPGGTILGDAIGTDTDSTQSLVVGDLDGDGDLDIVAGNRGQTNKFYLNNRIASGVDIGIEADDTYTIVLGDIDNDGDLDVLTANAGENGGQTNKLYLNYGNGVFSATGYDIGSDTDDTSSLILGDVNGDGYLDVLTGNVGQTNKLYVYDGGYASGVAIGSDTDSTYELALGDLDGDGDLDVVAGNAGQTSKLYRNDGSGNFASGVSFSFDITNTRSLTLGDVDGDGDLDLLMGNKSQTNNLYLNDGNGGFANAVDIGNVDDHTYELALGDVDGDGDLDVVEGNAGSTNKLYRNDGIDTNGVFFGFCQWRGYWQ